MTPARTPRPPTWAPTLAAAALVLLAATACTPAEAQPPAPTPTTSTTSTPASARPTTYRPPSPTTTRTTIRPTTRATATAPSVSGRVVDGRTGRPMGGVIVEFKNLSGGNVHTTTARDGSYALRLPPDVYTALALTDDPDSFIGFEVVGGDNSISVPPSARVDFRSYAIG